LECTSHVELQLQRLSRIEEQAKGQIETRTRRFFAEILNAVREFQLQIQGSLKRRKQRNDAVQVRYFFRCLSFVTKHVCLYGKLKCTVGIQLFGLLQVHVLSIILDMQEQELCLFSKYVNMIKMFEFVTVCLSWVNVKIFMLFFMSDFPIFLGQKIV
jgi:hypothetical protein